MIIVSIVLIILFIFFLTRKIEIGRPLDIILVNFLLVCSNIVVSFEITSLLGILNQPLAFVLVQAGLLLCAIIFYLFYKKEFRPERINLIEIIKEFFSFCKQHKLLTFLLILVTLAYLFLAYLSIIFPQNTTDSLYNHLARIAHWLQQSSLKPYDSFSDFGITYPYNNSLLMMWSVLFTHMDRLTGLLQWFASIVLALSIYGLAIELKFSKEQAGFSALIFLTFPILILESITAQNDILVAAFFIIGVYFFISGFQAENRLKIYFSAVSIALAAGTKQYLVFAVPGFLLILIYFIFKKEKKSRFNLTKIFIISLLGFTLILGSYAYIQNTLYYKNPTGNLDNKLFSITEINGTFIQKLAYNSSRLTTQFISCEGLPLPAENSCLEIKSVIMRKIFSNPAFNLENNQYLLETDCGSTCFAYSTRYPLNEESAWFGFLSWILIIPGVIYGVIFGIRKKELLPGLLLLTSFIYFLIISIFQVGWNAYVGRYLILSVALLMPFSGYLFINKRWVQKIFTGLITLMAIFILVYTIFSNDSKPLISKHTMVNIQIWGKSHQALIVTKVAYKLTPWFDNYHSDFDYNFASLRILDNINLYDPVFLVNKYVPLDGRLGIIANNGMFLDYLFFGDNLTRKVYDLPDYANQSSLLIKIQQERIDYLLISPGIQVTLPDEFQIQDHLDNWFLYARQ